LSVAKLVFFMTDGYHNYPPGTTFYSAADASKAAGITTVAIGVGSAVSVSQLNYIASSLPGVQTVYQVTDFSALASIKNQLVGVTCTTFQGSPCGSGCTGFCACGATCICPQCDTTNKCLTGTCTPGSFGTGCTYSAVNCNDNNACTTDTCTPSTGCAHTPIVCNSGDACIEDGCSASSGCTRTNKLLRGDCATGDPCKQPTCSSSTGCGFTVVPCDSCKIPIAGGGPRTAPRPCPDNASPNVAERDDGNKCKLWYCANNVTYSTTEYTTPAQTVGTCMFTMRDCDDNNACTIDSCDTTTGNCTHTPRSCPSDNNPCTHDLCSPSTGCYYQQWNISECYNTTVPSKCFSYALNSSLPTCCDVRNIGLDLCGKNKTDNCVSWRCLDNTGCDYFTRNCENEIGLDKLGDCQSATCTNGSGCIPQVLTGKQIDKCGYCDGSTASQSKCIGDLTVSEVAGISAGILAAIIIAVIVVCLICGAVGGKVGLDYYKKYKGKMSNLQSNPLYEDKAKGGVNPFFQESEMSNK